MNVSIAEICNKALHNAGAASIVNLSDRTTEGNQARLSWPIISEFVFRSVPWKCLAKRVSLTETTTAPAWGYAYSYVRPDDYVRLIGMEEQDAKYLEVGDTIQSDDSPLNLDYVYNCQDPTKYSADLVRALELNLTYDFIMGLSGDVKRLDRIRQDLERFFMPLVRLNNSIGAGQRIQQASTFTDMFL